MKGKINYLLQLLHIQRWQLSDTKTIFFSFLQSRVRCPLSQLVVINAVKEYKVDIMHEDLKKKKNRPSLLLKGEESLGTASSLLYSPSYPAAFCIPYFMSKSSTRTALNVGILKRERGVKGGEVIGQG